MKIVNNNQTIFDRAAEARIFLHIHGFLAESENAKVQKRINDYGDRMEVSRIKKPYRDDKAFR